MMTSEGLCLKPSDWSPLMAKRVEKPRRICEDDTKLNHKLKKLSSPCNPPQQPYPGSPLIIFHVYRHCPSSWRELLSPCSSALHSQWHDTLPLASYPLPLHSFFTLACTFATLLYWCAQFLPHSSLLPFTLDVNIPYHANLHCLHIGILLVSLCFPLATLNDLFGNRCHIRSVPREAAINTVQSVDHVTGT